MLATIATLPVAIEGICDFIQLGTAGAYVFNIDCGEVLHHVGLGRRAQRLKETALYEDRDVVDRQVYQTGDLLGGQSCG